MTKNEALITLVINIIKSKYWIYKTKNYLLFDKIHVHAYNEIKPKWLPKINIK